MIFIFLWHDKFALICWFVLATMVANQAKIEMKDWAKDLDKFLLMRGQGGGADASLKRHNVIQLVSWPAAINISIRLRIGCISMRDARARGWFWFLDGWRELLIWLQQLPTRECFDGWKRPGLRVMRLRGGGRWYFIWCAGQRRMIITCSQRGSVNGANGLENHFIDIKTTTNYIFTTIFDVLWILRTL